MVINHLFCKCGTWNIALGLPPKCQDSPSHFTHFKRFTSSHASQKPHLSHRVQDYGHVCQLCPWCEWVGMLFRQRKHGIVSPNQHTVDNWTCLNYPFKTEEMPTNLKSRRTLVSCYAGERSGQVNEPKSCLIRFCDMKSNNKSINERNHWNQTFTSKFPAKLADCPEFPINDLRLKVPVNSHTIWNVYCTVMWLQKQPSLTFSFFPLTTHSFPVCKKK